MALDLAALTFATPDPERLAGFWAGVLGDHGAGFELRFVRSDEPKRGPNQVHFDLGSRSWEEQAATVERVLEHGGQHLDIGQLPEELHVVMADPDGNEFCVTEPGNNFLAGCGLIGCLSSDGSQAVGYFWSAALGWPLVWDQDEETAIQSPAGGTKISWGGPPFNERTGRNRLHLDLVPSADSDLDAEVARLRGLGATRLDLAACDPAGVVLADVDGNELCVLPG
ncbi:VOC family protein [Nocardioides mangrovi]|uniref:VOC family protein n=1 Tax=Nocardioides mangrovi TaxID=2874580 RepID=A0ABS7UD55_9ACTN|nr:VOC family protein [Nocardioides mangrovi]MBZ5738795.1 VOC family protein [Nocardioides mangrovi]